MVVVVLLGMYKFNYLSGQSGYNVDGNKIGQIEKEVKGDATSISVNNTTSSQQCNLIDDKVGNNAGNNNFTNPGINVNHLISPKEFKEKLNSGEYVLVDIRTAKEDSTEKIPGTKLVLDFYKDDFKEKVSKLDKNKKYLYYCRSGHRSGEASELAKEFGFTEAYELDGGINAWKEAGYEIN